MLLIYHYLSDLNYLMNNEQNNEEKLDFGYIN